MLIKNTKNVDYENLALTQIFPSGWEIRNTRMDLHEDKKASQITYQDIRDDRVYSYFDIKEKESKIIEGTADSISAALYAKTYKNVQS